MSPKNTFITKLIFTFITVFISTQAQAASHEFCERYARHALEQFEVAKGENCRNLNYPVWSMDFNHHYNWCREVPEAQANMGGEQRVNVLRHCRNRSGQGAVIGTVTGTVTEVDTGQMLHISRRKSCQDYANSAVNQQQGNLEMRCGLSGPQWNPNYDDHYNWCMRGENLKYTQTEQQRRQDALNKCRGNASSPSVMKGSDGILERTRHAQLDRVFLQAVDQVAAGLENKIRDIQERAWSRSRDQVLNQFRSEVKAASYSEKKTLQGLPGRPDTIEQAPYIIGEIDKQTGQVKRGSERSKDPQVCNGVRYYGPPRITHILSSTKKDNYHVSPGDKLIIFGENFYGTPGRLEIQLPQGGGFLDIPLKAGNMNDWYRSWYNQFIVVDVPKLAGLFDVRSARLSMMITHPCSGQKHAYYDIKLTPRMVVRQISGIAFLDLAKGEKEDQAVDTKLEHRNFVKVSHYPGCGVKIPVIGAMSGSGEEGDDYFFKALKLPPQFTIKKAYLVPKVPGKDWAGLIFRITSDALNIAVDIISGDVIGAVLSVGGQAIEGLIKLFDSSVGKYGVWVTEYPPAWPHYRSHWNNTCYTKSPRFKQAIEYVGSFLVIGPEGLEPIPGWKNSRGVNGVSIAR